jgi:hypothetical protein
MAFQCSKVLDVDDDTYPIVSRYGDFILERHEAYRHSSELVSESIQMKLCCFFFLDIFFMRDHNLLSWTWSKIQTVDVIPLKKKLNRSFHTCAQEVTSHVR